MEYNSHFQRFIIHPVLMMVIFVYVVLSLTVFIFSTPDETTYTSPKSLNEERIQWLKACTWEIRSKPEECLKYLPTEKTDPTPGYSELYMYSK